MNSKNSEKLKISVAMCVFNGEKYVKEQLESIVKQTILPDEIVICDDHSSDSTVEILNEFKKISPVLLRIYVNETNLGIPKNFEKAISLCRGDIIFLSDGDDVWLPRKIEKEMRVFRDNKSISYVFSDAYVVDEKLHHLGYTMWESIRFGKKERNIFRRGKQTDVLLKHNVVTGATLAFRSTLRKFVIPIPETWIHDAWIALLGSIIGQGGFIEEPLIYYRQHPGQLIGGKKMKTKERTMDQLRKSLSTGAYHYFLIKQKLEIPNNRILALLGKKDSKVSDKIDFLNKRIKVYKEPGLSAFNIILHEFLSGEYSRYSSRSGFKSFLKDTFIVLRGMVNRMIKKLYK